MTQLIDKSALVAEIESLMRTTFTNFDEGVNATVQTLLEIVETLEVKEIGFDLGNNNKEYHRVPSTTLKRLYMNEAKYELLKSDIMKGIVGDFEKGTTHNYLTIKIPMLLCPSNCAKGDKVKLIIIKEE